jgi:hypothetical protein
MWPLGLLLELVPDPIVLLYCSKICSNQSNQYYCSLNRKYTCMQSQKYTEDKLHKIIKHEMKWKFEILFADTWLPHKWNLLMPENPSHASMNQT